MTISFCSSKVEAPTSCYSTETCKKCQVAVDESVLDNFGEDAVDISSKPQEKKGAWQRFKEGYSSFKKSLLTGCEYVKGTVKGLVYGGLVGLLTLGVDAARNMVKKSPKAISTKGKIAAGLLGGAVFVGNLFVAGLNANEKQAQVEHRWNTGHSKV